MAKIDDRSGRRSQLELSLRRRYQKADDSPFAALTIMTRLGLTPTLATALLFSALSALPVRAQVTATDLLVRLDQLENQVRQLTGAIEQLQYRNQQLETNLRKMQEDNEFRFKELGVKSSGHSASETRTPAPQQPAPQQQTYTPPQAQQQAYTPQQPAYAPPSEPIPLQPTPIQPTVQQPTLENPHPSGRRSDAFDPTQNPNAPGAPHQLGSLYASGRAEPAGSNEPSTGGGLPPPPPRNPSGTGAQLATLPPSQSPRDLYDLGNGYLVRRDYALAEQSFRAFLSQYPRDRLADDAQYGLGESLYRRANYRDAADAFLTLTKSYGSSPRAPEALLRLGQSLAALKEKKLACGAFAEIGRKYPRVSPTVKQTVAREQKRVGC
jgi:tol-pal system protein YbgF